MTNIWRKFIVEDAIDDCAVMLYVPDVPIGAVSKMVVKKVYPWFVDDSGEVKLKKENNLFDRVIACVISIVNNWSVSLMSVNSM